MVGNGTEYVKNMVLFLEETIRKVRQEYGVFLLSLLLLPFLFCVRMMVQEGGGKRNLGSIMRHIDGADISLPPSFPARRTS